MTTKEIEEEWQTWTDDGKSFTEACQITSDELGVDIQKVARIAIAYDED